jgi:hypothetical protein
VDCLFCYTTVLFSAVLALYDESTRAESSNIKANRLGSHQQDAFCVEWRLDPSYRVTNVTQVSRKALELLEKRKEEEACSGGL